MFKTVAGTPLIDSGPIFLLNLHQKLFKTVAYEPENDLVSLQCYVLCDFALWAPLGRHWAPFAPPWCRLWPFLGCLGTPLGSLWPPRGPPRGSPVPGEVASSEVPRIAIRSAFLELAAETTGTARTTGTTEVVSRTVAGTPPSTRAGGQDDGSYTNSLKQKHVDSIRFFKYFPQYTLSFISCFFRF